MLPSSTLPGPEPRATPAFALRAFHLDLRVQVMTPAALHRLADELVELGYNALVIEWEASFPYRRHATVSHERAYHPADVRGFLRHCREVGLATIPLQQTFGHLEHVLRHPRYTSVREDALDRCQLCPCRVEPALQLVRELIADIGEFHEGPWLHLGGDETYLLGHCPECRAYAEKSGRARLYTDFMGLVIEEAKKAGWWPIVWADMLLKHPEALSRLPRDTVLVDWNYGWSRNRFGSPELLTWAGFRVWGAAALRSSPDNHSLTWWERHFNNLRDFVPQARRDGYEAMVLTSWSTSGVFGYEWEDQGERVMALLPVRRVYPLSGHRLLLAAGARAFRQAEPVAPRPFLEEYGGERFGLIGRDVRRFADALLRQRPGHTGGRAIAALSSLRARRNRREFAHLQLMAEFHLLHAGWLRADRRYQSQHYTRRRAPALRTEVAQLDRRSRRLEAAYARLQRGYLHPQEIALDTAYRRAQLAELSARLKNQSA